MGATHKVYPDADRWNSLEERIAEGIQALYPGELEKYGDVAQWNDARTTTFTKVRNVIRKARI